MGTTAISVGSTPGVGRVRGRTGTTRIGVLTVLEEEFNAARRLLETTQNLAGTPYYARPGVTDPHSNLIVVTQCDGRSNVPAAQATEHFIEHFRPGLIILMGIAGGVVGREAGLGDVVLADFVDYYEYGKMRDGIFVTRREPHDHPSFYARHSIANPLRRETDWHAYIDVARPVAGTPKAVLGNIAAGEKVLMDSESDFQKMVLALYEKAQAVDMESWGFVRGVYKMRSSVHYNPQCLIIRGISDQADAVEEDIQAVRDAWREYAAAAAAAFTRSVVDAIVGLPPEARF